MQVGDLIKKLNKRDKTQTVYYRDADGLHEITDVQATLLFKSDDFKCSATATVIMNGDGGRYNKKMKG